MVSIWDPPNPNNTSTAVPVDKALGPGGTSQPESVHLLGTEAGPLWPSEGRGVRNGVPYGQQLQAEQADMDRRYRLMPSWADRLRAATRAALGR